MRWPIWPTFGEKCTPVVQQCSPLETLTPCSPHEMHTVVKRHVNYKPIGNANLWSAISIRSHCPKHIWSKFIAIWHNLHTLEETLSTCWFVHGICHTSVAEGGQRRFQEWQLWKRLNHWQISHYSACTHRIKPLPHTTREAVRSRSKPGWIHPRSLVSLNFTVRIVVRLTSIINIVQVCFGLTWHSNI